MTLLSIREQEAVKKTRDYILRWKDDVNPPPIVSLACYPEFVRHLDEYDRALILATRDAIARQVRERTKEFEARGTHQYLATEAATFIEGLGVDR